MRAASETSTQGDVGIAGKRIARIRHEFCVVHLLEVEFLNEVIRHCAAPEHGDEYTVGVLDAERLPGPARER